MRLRHVALIGLFLVFTSLIMSFASLIPEFRAYEDCRVFHVPAFKTLFVYWGNYSLPSSLKNISLTVVNIHEIFLNISYGISPDEARNVVSNSTFSYFIGNSTYFYLFVVPYESTELRVCLTGLVTSFRSYLLLPTIVLWAAGTVVIAYVTLMYFEQIFMKSARSKRVGSSAMP